MIVQQNMTYIESWRLFVRSVDSVETCHAVDDAVSIARLTDHVDSLRWLQGFASALISTRNILIRSQVAWKLIGRRTDEKVGLRDATRWLVRHKGKLLSKQQFSSAFLHLVCGDLSLWTTGLKERKRDQVAGLRWTYLLCSLIAADTRSRSFGVFLSFLRLGLLVIFYLYKLLGTEPIQKSTVVVVKLLMRRGHQVLSDAKLGVLSSI